MQAPSDRTVFALWRLAALLRHPRLHWEYLRRMRHVPDLARPRRFAERMLWRKAFDRDPLFPVLSDKLAVKDWWAEHAPGLPTPRVLWQGTDPAAIPDALFRPGVAIKCAHGSGFNILCRDGAPPRREAEARLRAWLARDFGRRRGEWAYRPVPRRVFVEELIIPPPGAPLWDIKVDAGGGRVGLVMLYRDTRTPAQAALHVDEHGRPVREVSPGYAPLPDTTPLPPAFRRAVALARRLSERMDYARFDFLSAGEMLFGGEVSLYSASGWWEPAPDIAAATEAMWDLRRSHALREGLPAGGWLARRYALALTRALHGEGLSAAAAAARSPPEARPSPR
jgi:hypothetical protein